MATVKAGERQWCDVGIFRNNTALVSQFYLLPKGKQGTSKVTAVPSLPRVTAGGRLLSCLVQVGWVECAAACNRESSVR